MYENGWISSESRISLTSLVLRLSLANVRHPFELRVLKSHRCSTSRSLYNYPIWYYNGFSLNFRTTPNNAKPHHNHNGRTEGRQKVPQKRGHVTSHEAHNGFVVGSRLNADIVWDCSTNQTCESQSRELESANPDWAGSGWVAWQIKNKW